MDKEIQTTEHSPNMTNKLSALVRIVSSLFFLSGFASLIYEVIWFKRFTHVWGSSTVAQMTVVTVFLFGLALGAFLFGRMAGRLQSPLKWYCICELLIGCFALLIPFEITALRWISSMLYPVLQAAPVLQFTTRFVLTFLAIGPCCILMGGTLPLLIEHFLCTQPWNHETTGWLYAVNTLGAACGSFVAGFFLLPYCGMLWSNGIGVIINWYVALLVYLLLRQMPSHLSAMPRNTASQGTPFPHLKPGTVAAFQEKAVYLAAGLTGCSALILQMVWTRDLSGMLGGTTYAFSSMLFVFLLGIGLGSIVYSWSVKRIDNPFRVMSAIVCLLLLSTALGHILIPSLSQGIGYVRDLRANPSINAAVSLGASAALQFLPTLCMGFIFPLFIDLLRMHSNQAGVIVGNVYTWNTAGSILGAAFTPVALIAVWGSSAATALAMLMYGLSLLIVLLYQSEKSYLPWLSMTVLGALSIGVVCVPLNPLDTNMGHYLYGYTPSHILKDMYKVLFFEEGAACNVLVVESDYNRNLRVNGKVDASDRDDMPMQLGLAYYPRFFNPTAENVLVIGYGSGTTAGASLLFPNTRVTCCEIEPAVVKAGMQFSHVNHNPQNSENLELVLDDGRSFLEGSRETYGLILSEPSNPWMAGISNLFTREFYYQVKQHLNPGGIFTQWIHTYKFTFSEYSLIARTVSSVFPHCALIRISQGDTLILASNDPLQPTYETITTAQSIVNQSAEIKKDLNTYFSTSDVSNILLRNYMMNTGMIHRLCEEEKEPWINTDINLRLEFVSPLHLFLPASEGENVDKILAGFTEPDLWIERFQEWQCPPRQISTLQTWLSLYKMYGFQERGKALIDFALAQVPDDTYWLAESLYFPPANSPEFNNTLNTLLSSSIDETYQAGVELWNQGRYGRAEQVFEKIADQNPTWTTCLTYLALCREKTGQRKKAEETYLQAFLIDPKNPFLTKSYNHFLVAKER